MKKKDHFKSELREKIRSGKLASYWKVFEACLNASGLIFLNNGEAMDFADELQKEFNLQ